jgi:hypothetical protein
VLSRALCGSVTPREEDVDKTLEHLWSARASELSIISRADPPFMLGVMMLDSVERLVFQSRTGQINAQGPTGII